MKNPFVQMAVMAAAMVAAFQENNARDAGLSMGSMKRTRSAGPRNPAGTKLVRGFYRNKFGAKGTRGEAIKWYAALKSPQ